ncbi:zinc finger protein 813-like [Xenia sp. Carnegie-2017]|uniref:zinc finger protein 813-like n=1 Tax=Xenia sp. Carnegie-2017 TaxID=2897299 RepID=UPI001F045D55|nr:zinc finger protein 813-like [Xenia sp. Carnegie-2017]
MMSSYDNEELQQTAPELNNDSISLQTSQRKDQSMMSSYDNEELQQTAPELNNDQLTQEIVDDNSDPQTLYVAIQPSGGNHGDISNEQPAVYLEVVETGNLSEQISTVGLNREMIVQQATSTSDNGVSASSILTVGHDALSTMQAEMIAVQVLSQSGDVQLFQDHAGNTAQIVPVTTISNSELQTLTQANLVTSSISQSSSTADQDFSSVSMATDIGTNACNEGVATVAGDCDNHNESRFEENENVEPVLEEKIAEDAAPGELEKPKYTCEICGKAYIRSWSFYGHMREHASGDKIHKCSVCHKVFNYASNLRQHMLIHTGEKPYECEYCDKAFNNPSSLRSHLLSHSEDKPYSCDVSGCDKAFNNPGSLRVHRRVHQNEKPFTCPQTDCDKSFKTQAELSRHVFRHTGQKPYKCDECDKAFIRFDDLKRHYRIHTGEKPFKCDQCDFACIQSFDLVKHKYTHSGDKPYKCHICPKQFTRPARLRDHLRTHTGEKPFTCNVCGKSFAVQTGLKSHMAVHTGDKPFKCNECDRSFRTQPELQGHMGRHTGIKPFKCNICEKEFISAVTFKRHAIVHSGEKPFQCDQCGRRFARSTDLKVHLPVHSDDKPYKCGECDKMFTRFSTLKEHIRTHTGERPFKCDTCGRQFNHRSHFNNHLRIHTGEKPFKCEICGKAFSRKASVRYHMKVHGVTMTPDGQTTRIIQTSNSKSTSAVDHEQVVAGQVVSQLANETDVQLAEVLVAVSDALVAANQEQASVDAVHLVEGHSHGHGILETGHEEGVETDMTADQNVPIITSEASAEIIANAHVIEATNQLTEEQIMQVSSIANVQTSDGQLIEAHVIDPSQLRALGVITEPAKDNHIEISEMTHRLHRRKIALFIHLKKTLIKISMDWKLQAKFHKKLSSVLATRFRLSRLMM